MELNKYLQSNNSPIAQNQRLTSAYEFNSQFERNSVDLTKIKNFTFSAGTGGTLVLGGANNGNGLMQVKDSSGAVIVSADNTGILIEGGNIIVKNADNTTIIDTSGIVSTANFASDQIVSSTTNETSGTSYISLPGSTMDTFILDRDIYAFITVLTLGYNVGRAYDTSYNMSVKVVDSIDGDLITYSHNGNWMLSSLDISADQDLDLDIDFGAESYSYNDGINVDYNYGMDCTGEAINISAYILLSAGTHTLNIKYKANNGGTATITSFLLNYGLFGS
jgi:hypothetical protein